MSPSGNRVCYVTQAGLKLKSFPSQHSKRLDLKACSSMFSLSHPFLLLFLLFILCMCAFNLYICQCTTCIVNRHLWATMWVLEIEPRSSGRAVNALNLQAISLCPPPNPFHFSSPPSMDSSGHLTVFALWPIFLSKVSSSVFLVLSVVPKWSTSFPACEGL